MDKDIKSAIAVTRFGLGAKIGEIKAASSDPQGYLIEQLSRPEEALITAPNLRSSLKAVQDYYGSRQDMRALDKTFDAEEIAKLRKSRNREAVDYLRNDIDTRLTHAITTNNSFLERWVRFWGNHFTVSARQVRMYGLVGSFERETIRPYVLGSFLDMAMASSLHPAMLIYLDNYRSIGPHSSKGRSGSSGLNVNLAREILELHTVGVGAHSQRDVEGFAKALTGWTIETKPGDLNFGRVTFRERWHEPGAKYILGRNYSDDGIKQVPQIISDLSSHPATAKNIATKLIRHFIADEPSVNDIDKLARVFIKSNGNLKALAKAVVRLESAWTDTQPKFKSPDDWIVSAGRLLGNDDTIAKNANSNLLALGQPIFRAPSPQGYSDVAADWIDANAIQKRLEFANRVARRVARRISAERFLEEALGPLATAATRQAVARADTQVQALTLALMSPEFQRR